MACSLISWSLQSEVKQTTNKNTLFLLFDWKQHKDLLLKPLNHSQSSRVAQHRPGEMNQRWEVNQPTVDLLLWVPRPPLGRQEILQKALTWFCFSVLAVYFPLAQTFFSPLAFQKQNLHRMFCPWSRQTEDGDPPDRLVLSAHSLCFHQPFWDLCRCLRVSEDLCKHFKHSSPSFLVLWTPTTPHPSPPTVQPVNILDTPRHLHRRLVYFGGQGVTVCVCVCSASADLFMVCQLSAPSLRVKRGRLLPTAPAAKSCCSALLVPAEKLTN